MEENDGASVERPIDPRRRPKAAPSAPIEGLPADQTSPYGQQAAGQPPSLQPPSLQPPSLQPPSLQPQSLQPQSGLQSAPSSGGAPLPPVETRRADPPAGIPYEQPARLTGEASAATPFEFDGPVKSPGGGLSRGFLVGAVLLVVIIGGTAGALLARGGDSATQPASVTTSMLTETSVTPALEPSVAPTTAVPEQEVEPTITQEAETVAEDLDRVLLDSDRLRSADEPSPDFEVTDENAFLTDVHFSAGDGLVAIGYVDDVPAVWSWSAGQPWERELISVDGASGDESSIYQVAATDSAIVVNGDHDAETSFLWSNGGSGWVVDVEDKGETYDVLGGERGFMGAGERQGVATVWSSKDGSTWSGGTALPVSDDAFYSTVIDVCRCGDGFLATGIESREGGSSVAIWRSDDGQRWSRIPHSSDLVLVNEEDGWGYGAAQLGGSIVVVGIDGDAEPTIWLASDGERFRRLDLDPAIFSSEEGDELYGITSDGRRAIAYGTNSAGDAKAWLSVDGATWEIVEGIFNPRSGPISSIIYRDGVFVLAGSTWAISHWIPEVWYIE